MVIKVPIIVSYNNKGTKQATKGIGSLEKSFKKMGLASKFGYAAAGTAALAFAKKSITAALADQKQQAVLAKTLQNVGESFATASVTKYIDSLQRATGVSEDQLRPAFNKLVTATQSAAKAQDLLALSLDISAATGKSSESVAAALSKAYLGNNTALSKLGVGLTKTELKAMTFEETTQKLSTLFGGQASTTANTYAGQLAILGVAADEASETIGTALIDSLVKLGGQNGAKDLAKQMETLAQSTADVISGITIAIGYFQKLGNSIPSWLKTVLQILERFSPLGQAKEALKGLEAVGKKQRELLERAAASDRGLENQAADRRDKAAKTALKNNAKEVAGKKQLLSLAKQTAANEKLARMFDMDAIQLAAALQGKLSKEDEARVKALQALKTEDKNDDITALKNLEDAKREATFAEIERLKMIVEASKRANEAILADTRARIEALGKISFSNQAAYSVGAAGSTFAPGLKEMQTNLAAGTVPDLSYLNFDLAALGSANAQMEAGIAAQQSAVVVNVNPTGSGFIGNQDDFLRTVQLALQIGNSNGYSLSRAGS
jgi:hypothetical protein